ncbi:MAG: hypothetical protein ABGX25_02390 [Nautiliaceae bacterium]
MKKESYKDFVYLKIPKDEWEQIEKTALKKGKHIKQLSYDDLIRYKFAYELGIESKQISASEAHRRKKAKKDMQIYKTLENYFTGLFKSELEHINPYKLSKLAKVNYRTAKRFWEEYNLDYWIPKFEKNSETLKEFLYKELSESIIYNKN